MQRKDIPASLTNLALWPSIDPNALSPDDRKQYRLREEAIRGYVAGESLADIEKRVGIARRTLHRLIDRCIAPHPDGRIQGFRALIPFVRVKPYTRIKPIESRQERGGLVGAFGQLLAQYPRLAGVIERHIAHGGLRLSNTGRVIGLRRTQEALLAACREMNLTARDYPLNQDEMAYRSLAKFARTRLEARVPLRIQSSNNALAMHPFSVVELDGHKLDVRVRVRFTEPTGLAVDVETERLFVIVIIDVCTRAVLGWQLVLAPEYNRFDVLLAVQNALLPRRKRKVFSIPGLAYETTGGFVSEACPEVAYACWNVLKFDNARSHLAEDTLASLCEFVGCRTDAGPVGRPTSRPYVERFFRTLTDRLCRRLPGTTGSNPQDAVGRKGKKHPVEHLITIEELDELLDVTIANYNGAPHDGLNGHTPLEAMQQLLDRQDGALRTLPHHLRSRIHQLQPVHASTVRGNPARSVAPYISLYGARYSNEVLERTTGLLKTQIRVYLNPDDMREAWAYLPNGAELGQLNVLSGWRYTRHTLRLRQHILRLRRRGKLKFSDEQDPVTIHANAQRAKTRQRRKEATQTAQVTAVVNSAEPSTVTNPVSPPTSINKRQRDTPIIPIPLPDMDVQNF